MIRRVAFVLFVAFAFVFSPALAQLRPPTLPPVRVTKTVTSAPPDANGWCAPLLTVHGSTTQTFVGTEYVQYATGGATNFLVTDMNARQSGWTATNCIFRFVPGPGEVGWPNGGRWCWRVYELDVYINRCIFAAAGEEHPIYVGIAGDSEIRDTTVRNAGSQGLQFSLKAIGRTEEQSVSWNKARTLHLVDVNVLECGRRGGTRLGFAVSVFKHGPQFRFVAERLFVQTVKQSQVVTNSAGQWCDSTGGIFIAGCAEAILTDCTVELKNPEKGCAQFYNFTDKPESSNAPRNLELNGCTFIGGDVHVRTDETPRVRVNGCKGNARLRLWRWNAATQKYVNYATQLITANYSQGRRPKRKSALRLVARHARIERKEAA